MAMKKKIRRTLVELSRFFCSLLSLEVKHTDMRTLLFDLSIYLDIIFTFFQAAKMRTHKYRKGVFGLFGFSSFELIISIFESTDGDDDGLMLSYSNILSESVRE